MKAAPQIRLHGAAGHPRAMGTAALAGTAWSEKVNGKWQHEFIGKKKYTKK